MRTATRSAYSVPQNAARPVVCIKISVSAFYFRVVAIGRYPLNVYQAQWTQDEERAEVSKLFTPRSLLKNFLFLSSLFKGGELS